MDGMELLAELEEDCVKELHYSAKRRHLQP
jgi:hypothetical protein